MRCEQIGINNTSGVNINLPYPHPISLSKNQISRNQKKNMGHPPPTHASKTTCGANRPVSTTQAVSTSTAHTHIPYRYLKIKFQETKKKTNGAPLKHACKTICGANRSASTTQAVSTSTSHTHIPNRYLEIKFQETKKKNTWGTPKNCM